MFTCIPCTAVIASDGAKSYPHARVRRKSGAQRKRPAATPLPFEGRDRNLSEDRAKCNDWRVLVVRLGRVRDHSGRPKCDPPTERKGVPRQAAAGVLVWGLFERAAPLPTHCRNRQQGALPNA